MAKDPDQRLNNKGTRRNETHRAGGFVYVQRLSLSSGRRLQVLADSLRVWRLVRPTRELAGYHFAEFVCFPSWTEGLRDAPNDRLGDDREAPCIFSASTMQQVPSVVKPLTSTLTHCTSFGLRLHEYIRVPYWTICKD